MSRRRNVGRDTSSAGPSIARWLGGAVSTQANHRQTKITRAERQRSGPDSILWMRDIVHLTGVLERPYIGGSGMAITHEKTRPATILEGGFNPTINIG